MNKIFKALTKLPLWCLIGLTFATHPLQAASELDRIIAVVNDDVIMMSELENKIRSVVEQMRQAGQNPPPPTMLEKQILESIVINKLQLQLADRNGIRVDDETLNQSVLAMAEQNGVTLSEFRNILENDGYSFEQFREDIRNEITISRLKQRRIANRVVVTDREIDNFLSNAEVQGLTEAEYLIGHILISVPEGSDEEERLQRKLIAEQVLSDLRDGQDFRDMARKVSDGVQAAEGGDLGMRKMQDVPTLFSADVAEMKEGDISDLIENSSGYHIIKLHEVSSGSKNMVRQTRASHILVKTNEIMDDEQAKNKLQELLYRIDQGEEFEKICRSNSEDTLSALEGGDLGWRSPGELVPQFEQQMDRLAIGEMSEPFKTQFGWHVVKVLDRRDFDNTDNARRTAARNAIRERKIKENEQEWLRKLREEAFVQYRLDGT